MSNKKKYLSPMTLIIRLTIYEMLKVIQYIWVQSIYPLSKLIVILLPYIMFIIGGGKFKLGIKIFIPLILLGISWFLGGIANKLGKGDNPPIPLEPFTTEDEYGELSIRQDRIQELILFTSDYESWLKRKGLL